jgi:cell division protein FtsQ
VSTPDPTTRRSDEIRRRRMMQSHTIHAAGVGVTRPGAKPHQPSLLERMLGNSTTRQINRRSSKAQRAATPPPAAPSTGRRSARSAPRSTTSTQPPVLMRGPSSARLTANLTGKTARSAAAPAARRDTRGRKVYNVALNSQGAEMRLPSLPRVHFSWRVASLFLLAFLGVALYGLWTMPRFQVEAAEVNGLQRLTPGLVNKELGLTGKPVFTLDPGQIQQQLLTSFPEISAAQVYVELPNSVSITVTERVPVLIWKQDSREHLVDAEGMTFPARQDLPPGALPVVQALGDPPLFSGSLAVKAETAMVPDSPEQVLESVKQMLPDNLRSKLPDENRVTPLLTPEMVKAILDMTKLAPDGSQIMYDKAHGFGWQDKRGWMVYFGNFEDMSLKLQVYRTVLDKLKTAGVRPDLISLEYVYAPFYRVKEEQ